MSRAESLNALYDRIRRIEAPAAHGVLSFEVEAIDRALPGGGLALGAVHEILGAGGDEEDGAAAAGFIAGILARLGPHPMPPTSPSHRCAMGPSLSPLKGGEGKPGCHTVPLSALGGGEGRGEVGDSRALGSGPVLWCLKRPDLYGPGLAAHGLDPARLVLVVAKRDDEILWAIEEGLRTPGLAAVIGEVGCLPMVAGRRLQLAAERSRVTALLLRRWRNAEEAAAERERPSAALTRWRVTAMPSCPHPPSASRRTSSPAKLLPLPPLAGGEGWGEGGGLGWGIGTPRWRVELLRCRGGAPAAWNVEVADATGHVSLSAALADRPAAPPRRKAAGLEIRPFRRAG